MGRAEDMTKAWNEALRLHATLAMSACRERGAMRSCEKGTLSVSRGAISFVAKNGKSVFSVEPGEITGARVLDRFLLGYRFKANGKMVTIEPVPPGLTCTISTNVQCPGYGNKQQLYMAKYLLQAMPLLANKTP